MAPTTRSSANSDPKFPIILMVDKGLSAETIRTFLDQTNHELLLVAKRDLSVLLTGDSDDEQLDTAESFKEDLPKSIYVMNGFMDAIAKKPCINGKAFVILDDTTGQDRSTCLVAADVRDNPATDYLTFRCQFSSALSALEELDHGDSSIQHAIRRLRNEAALAGGTWSKATVEKIKSRKSLLDPSKFSPSKDWDTNCAAEFPDSARPYVPVFRSAEISLKTLNEFLKSAYDQDWGDDSTSDPRVSFITALEPPYGDGPAAAPLKTTPDCPDILLGARPSEYDAVVRSAFAAKKPDLNYNRFIVMDELTETEKTVILATNAEREGELVIARSDFGGALISLLSLENTSLTLEQMAHEGAMKGDPVIHGP
ncbi:hypothetical protein SCAR479_04489 [Seiridium cardinale]|uniref:Uncharacterized protein n=1 Tax=Seiridium cardinale TaxID=138064 RepID=A0ABR2XXI6_9PEZI